MLSDRRQIVLSALIEEYIAYAMPVGSRTLVERYDLGISSATVRNELSLLEEAGYVAQPHTSAGRIPTDHGYRAFVDRLLESDEVQADASTVEELRSCGSELDELMTRTTQVLARLTDCMTLLVPPRISGMNIKMINVVSLGSARVLIVVITEDGQVLNRQSEAPTAFTDEDVAIAQEAANHVFAGKPVQGMQDLPGYIDAPGSAFTRFVIDEVIMCLEGQDAVKHRARGISRLLGKPEFSDSSRLLPVLEELEDDTMLLHVFDDALHSDGPLIRIGSENISEALSGVSLIATRFGEEDQQGLIAIVGPTRMNYSQVFKAVRAAKNVLQDH